MIKPHKPDYSEILFLAFRYCLGRSTYITNVMVSWLKHDWKVLNDWSKMSIKKEIKYAIDHNLAGMQMDIDAWKEILEL